MKKEYAKVISQTKVDKSDYFNELVHEYEFEEKRGNHAGAKDILKRFELVFGIKAEEIKKIIGV